MLTINIDEAKYNFEELGFYGINEFLNESELKSLRQEVDFLFSKNLIHGHAFSVFINPRRQEIPQALAKITSVNLFEKALDIIEVLQSIDYEKFKNVQLAHMAIYKEHKNPVWLRWHSDIREGQLTRCQIVLRGGQEDSGAFVYIPGSHKLGSNILYRPSENYLEKNKDNIVMMNKPNGTAFIINTLGYHSRTPVKNGCRISIMMDFADSNYIKANPHDIGSNLFISFHQLSDRILKNIDKFKIAVTPGSFNANSSDHYRFSQKLGGYLQYKLKALYLIKKYFSNAEDY